MLQKESMNTLVSQTPIVQQALYFLQQASIDGGVKLTEKGALNRKFVQAFWDLYIGTPEYARFRPTREFECSEVSRVHFLLSESKYVRKFKGKISLTEKGKAVLKNDQHDELYYALLTVGIYGWNWGYEDRYPDHDFIQRSGEELIRAIQVASAQDVTPAKIFGMVFGDLSRKLSEDELDELLRCLTVRFFYRFCIPFGILKDEKDLFMMSKKTNDSFEKTEFFRTSFPSLIKSFSARVDGSKTQKNTAMSFTPMAQEFWNTIDPKLRVRLMNNIFCPSCKGETGIGNVSGSVEKGNLILTGVCTKCGESVARLVEGQ